MLSVLLLTKKANHTANVLLAVAMFALSLDVFHSAFIMFGYYKDFPHFTGVTYAFTFLYGPIFYLYAKIISTDNHTFNKKYFLHFIPFLIVMLYGFLFVYLRSSEFKLSLIANREKPFGLEFFDYMKPVHGLIYTFLTIQVVRVFNNKIRNSFSNIEQINLNWLKHLTIGLSIIWSIVVVNYIADEISARDINMDHFIYMAVSVLVYSIGYLSLRQPRIFDRTEKVENKIIDNSKVKTAVGTSYKKSGLADSEAEKYLNKLLQIMKNVKPYLNSELTLRDLADKLSISTHNLSEILNTRLNQNFYDFINQYRIEEVKKRLTDIQFKNYSIIAVAFDSGFNSKSAFNTIFKKHTGLTPSQYRRDFMNNLKVET